MVGLSERDDRSAHEKIRWMRRENGTPDDDVRWKVNGSHLDSYNETFAQVLDGYRIEDLIANADAPVVIDLMASSLTLVSLAAHFPEKPFKGISVAFADDRDESTKSRDSRYGVTQITGDITKNDTWRKIDEALDGKKADLILERAAGPLDYFALNEKFLSIVMSRMWNMLKSDQATILLQTPPESHIVESGIRQTEWLRAMAKIGAEVKSYLPYNSRGAVKISRTKDSSFQLPILPRKSR